MGKKSAYSVPQVPKVQNPPQHTNRVDVFRPPQKVSDQTTPSRDNFYTNIAFIASNDVLDSNNNEIVDTNQQVIWTVPFHKTTRTGKLTIKPEKASSNRKKIVITSIIIFALLALAAIGLALGLTMFRSTEYMTDECPKCTNNQYCIKPLGMRPTCVCKPGFNGSACQEKSICFDGYTPYTDIKNNSIPITPSESTNLRALCCPSNSISNQCCGIPLVDIPTKSKRIIGGSPSREGNWPWVVDVVQVYRNSTHSPIKIVNNCSGALITERHVLTAAHCLDLDSEVQLNNEFNTQASVLRVHYGFTDKIALSQLKNRSNNERNVSKIIIHEKFNVDLLHNDIAILVLDKPIERSTYVDYLCLYNYGLDDRLISNQKLYAVGWGSTNPEKDKANMSYSNSLQYVDLDVQDMSECYYIQPSATDLIFNKTTQVCAGYKVSDPIKKDTCYADSGSPLMVKLNGQWFSYGIVSYGSQDDCAKGPAIYTRVAAYYDWIKSKIQ